MTEKELEKLPELQIYCVDAGQIHKFSPLFTKEAAMELAAGTAIGLIAVEGNTACGAICVKQAEDNEAILELLSLYVVPEYRRKAVAGTLFLEVMETAFEETDGLTHCCRCVWTKDREGVAEFLEKAGFQTESPETAGSFRISAKELKECPLGNYRAYMPKEYRMTTVSELSALEKKLLFQKLSEASVAYMTEEELEMTCKEISYVVWNAGNEPVACALFTAQEGRILLSQFFIGAGPAGEGVKMLQICAEKLSEYYGEETELEIPVLTDSSRRLMEKLLGECRRIPMYTAYFEM